MAADSERLSVAWAWVFPVATVAASAVRKALRKEELKRMQKDLCLKLCSVCIMYVFICHMYLQIQFC